jgi:hypothetical protein
MIASGKSILIGPGITGGIGLSAEGYGAKEVPFEVVPNMSVGVTSHSVWTAIPGYSFNFFGTIYSHQVFVNQDGTLTFGAAVTTGDNVDLSHAVNGQTRPAVPMIAALWDDFTFASIVRKSVNVDGNGVPDMVIQWNNMFYMGDASPTDVAKLQIVLFDDGRIQINYLDIDTYPGNSESDTTVAKTGGISATVGIWKGGASPEDAVFVSGGTFVPGLHTFTGALDSGGGESNDSYVRMAWDTGGAAWDFGVVSEFGVDSAPSNKLRDTFIASVASQIEDAASHGRVARADSVVAAYNLGDGAISSEGFATDPFTSVGTPVSISPSSRSIYTQSNSIPVVGASETKMQEVFRTARRSSVNSDLNLMLPSVASGTYIVELFFANIISSQPHFDVLIEGKTYINNYQIDADRGRVIEFETGSGPSETELDVDFLGNAFFVDPGGIVKRFQVDVGNADGQAGLQILLKAEEGRPYINGLRILRADPIGDYNRDGAVDAADYTVWRDTLGSTTDLRADGNGDGIIDATDYMNWKAGYGFTTGLILADFSRNGATDIADYNLWASTLGSTTDLRADCNEDGIVDEEDYEVWFDTFGSTLAIGQFGLLSSMFDPDAPPAVVGFALSLPGDATVDFAGKVGSGEQIRSVPLTAANTLSITFSQDVVVAQNALEVTNLDGTSPTVLSFAYDAAAQTATWTFTAALANGRFLVRLSDSVENIDGEALDGEFFNPTTLNDVGTAVFPSGDGDEGGEFRFRFTVLLGDDNHDNIHNAANYQNWQSTEPGMIIVSTTADDWDASLAFGDVSLREAVNYANTAGSATAIQLPAGRYVLTRVGSEGSNSIEYNDLDITGVVTIVGAGPGLSIIDATQLGSSTQRAFDVIGAGDRLTLQRVTIAHGIAASDNGLAVRVAAGGALEILETALVHHTSLGGGSAIYVDRGDLTIRRSVITDNQNNWTGGAAVYVVANGGGAASVTVGESIFALNSQYQYPVGNTTRNIQVVGNVTKTNEGHNLYDNAAGGFFDTTPGAGDHLGVVDYVVTTVADTFDHSNNLESLSLREAVDLANTTAGTREIWLPAWRFTLTRDRGTNATDTNVSYGDLDVKNSMTIRGVEGRTSIGWTPAVVDEVFKLHGDANHDGVVDAADYTMWQDQNGSSGAWGQFSADVDDDGDVDEDDYDLWAANYEHTLTLSGIEL